MIEPILSLAFSIQSSPGVYALLLGSGVSRAAGIPTGWEIVLDLIRKLAYMTGEDCEPKPEIWYKEKYGEEPDYSNLLGAITKSPTERSQLLKSYFEPSDEDREHGLKLPTEAHKAIAEMVTSGHIRVIITTNFDRLMEKALEDMGIAPIIISTPEAVEGALPLMHTKCSIIKIHGDYLDSRIKNTPKELSVFDERLDGLIDRVFDEFGLVISGWSAEWDFALRAALERCKNHRFTTWWTVRRELGEAAKKLVALRRADIIKIKDANSFFREIDEKVSALVEILRPHPLSAKVAIARLKKYIVNEHDSIRLNDLVSEEIERLYSELSEKQFPVVGVSVDQKELIGRVSRYEALIETVLSLIINGCFWGTSRHIKLWTKSLSRIAKESPISGYRDLIRLRLYPALLLLYGGGIACIASENYEAFAALVTTKLRHNSGEEYLLFDVNLWSVMEEHVQKMFPGQETFYTPLSNHLYDVLRDYFKEILPDDIQYENYFARFEYLITLICSDLNKRRGKSACWLHGRYAWRYTYGKTVQEEIAAEVEKEGENWPLIKLGFFNGSGVEFFSIKSAVDDLVRASNWR